MKQPVLLLTALLANAPLLSAHALLASGHPGTGLLAQAAPTTQTTAAETPIPQGYARINYYRPDGQY
ncbi:MAG: hypothetical protein ACR2J4_01465, partial [Deinococcus sp.]